MDIKQEVISDNEIVVKSEPTADHDTDQIDFDFVSTSYMVVVTDPIVQNQSKSDSNSIEKQTKRKSKKSKTSDKYLDSHSKDSRVSEEVTFRCSVQKCNKTFKTYSTFDRHMNSHRIQNKEYIEKTVNKPLFYCNYENCHKSFTEEANLRRHITNGHKKRDFFKNCSKNKSVSDRHLNTNRIETSEDFNHCSGNETDKTGEVPLFVCTYQKCHKSFKEEANLRRHIANSHKKRNVLRKYPKNSKEEDAIDSDYRSTDKSKTDKPFFCCTFEDCYKFFSEKSVLKKHISDDHKQTESVSIEYPKTFLDRLKLNEPIDEPIDSYHSVDINEAIKQDSDESNADTVNCSDGYNSIDEEFNRVRNSFDKQDVKEDIIKQTDDKILSNKIIKRKKTSRKPSEPSETSINSDDVKKVRKVKKLKKVKKIVEKKEETDEFVCDFIGCGKICLSKSGLGYHKRFHYSADNQSRDFICETCGKGFLFKSHLNIHVKRLHTELERKFVCDICGNRFKLNNDLSNHVRKCHLYRKSGVYTNRLATAEREVWYKPIMDSDGQYDCNWPDCTFKTDKEFDFTNHMKGHKFIDKTVDSETGAELYKCLWPGCQFTTRRAESKHGRHKFVHLPGKRWLCDWPECGKAFKYKRLLSHHQKIHIRANIHYCEWPECSYSSIDKANFNKHRQKHLKNSNIQIVTENVIFSEIFSQ